MRLFVTSALVLFATVAPAIAQPKRDQPAPPPAPRSQTSEATTDCTRARAAGKTCVLSIEEESVTGNRVSSGETSLAIAQFTHAASLIQLRRDFIPEIVKTAEDL